MFANNKDAVYEPKNRFVWYLLALQGGLVNAAGFLCVHNYVSHVTGLNSQFAAFLANHDWTHAIASLCFLLFFLFGAFISGAFTQVRRDKGQAPIYLWINIGLAVLYFLLALFGELGHIGEFYSSTAKVFPRDIIIMTSLCFACGAQNALFTQASGAIVRTTHLTGLTTDLGVGLAQAFYKSGDSHKVRLANKLRIGLIMSFTLGAFLAFIFFVQWEFKSFFVPTFISLIVSYRLYKTRLALEVA